MELKFAELHTPLFLNGVNWGLKLDVKNTTKGKIKLVYDRDAKELLVTSGENTAIIPTSNVVSMTPMPQTLDALVKHDLEPAVNPMVNPGPRKRVTAQVSTPQDHVFKGQGAGKTND